MSEENSIGYIHMPETEVKELLFITPGKCYEWQPQEDITTYELARLMPFLLAITIGGYVTTNLYDILPDNCKRHIIIRE